MVPTRFVPVSRELIQRLSLENVWWRTDNDICFSLSGPDHLRYLQGRLTQNIKSLAPNTLSQSLLLTSNGRMQGVFSVAREDEAVVLCAWNERDRAEQLRSHILQFKVADRVDTADLALARVTTWGSQSKSSPIPETKSYISWHENYFAAPVVHNFLENVEVPQLHPVLSKSDGEALDFLLRLLRFHPLDGDYSENTLGAELPAERFVSFTKGCYTGQEVIEMATSRGKAPREMILVATRAELLPGECMPLFDSIEPGAADKPIGQLTSGVWIPETGAIFGFATIANGKTVASAGVGRVSAERITSDDLTQDRLLQQLAK